MKHFPGGKSLAAALVTEIVLTGFFLYIILGATDPRAPQGFAPIAIGAGPALIHLISIPIDNTAVNPARSTGMAFFNGHGASGQLWLLWVAPIIGAAIAGATYAIITGMHREDLTSPATSRLSVCLGGGLRSLCGQRSWLRCAGHRSVIGAVDQPRKTSGRAPRDDGVSRHQPHIRLPLPGN